MNNEQKLLTLYNELDDALRIYYQNENRNESVIMLAIKDFSNSGNAKYEEYGRKLNMIRIIRNDLIHNLDMNRANFISVNDDTIEFLNNLINVLKNPKRAYDISTKFKNIYFKRTSNKDIKIQDLIKLMREKGFSQLPILNDNNSLFGVFSSNVLFEYLKDYSGNVNELTLKDLLYYLPIDKHFSEKYLFINSNMNIEDVSNKFIDSYKRNEKPVMGFVTQSGKEKEPILGIIVIEDLIKEV